MTTRREMLAAGAVLPTIMRTTPKNTLKAPSEGRMPVAFVLGQSPTPIDFRGPWSVFESVQLMSAHRQVTASGGMTILPNRRPAW